MVSEAELLGAAGRENDGARWARASREREKQTNMEDDEAAHSGAPRPGIAAPPTMTFTIKPPEHVDFSKP